MKIEKLSSLYDKCLYIDTFQGFNNTSIFRTFVEENQVRILKEILKSCQNRNKAWLGNLVTSKVFI